MNKASEVGRAAVEPWASEYNAGSPSDRADTGPTVALVYPAALPARRDNRSLGRNRGRRLYRCPTEGFEPALVNLPVRLSPV
jgi:hypothetical protein